MEDCPILRAEKKCKSWCHFDTTRAGDIRCLILLAGTCLSPLVLKKENQRRRRCSPQARPVTELCVGCSGA